MGMLINAAEDALLNLVFRNQAYANIGDASGLQPSATAGNFFFSAATAWPGEAAVQNTSEATYTGYARPSVARSTGAWSAPSGGQINPAAVISFGERTDAGAQQDLFYFIIGTASSGAGNAVAWGVMGDATFGARTFVANSIANDTFFVPAHGLATDDRIAFFAFEPGGALPTGVTEGTVYFVRAAALTTDEFTVATTSGGAAINITALGAGYCAKVKPIAVTQNVTPQLKTTTIIRFS